MTETTTKDEGEFARIIDKVKFSAANLHSSLLTDEHQLLFAVSAKDLISAAKKDFDEAWKKFKKEDFGLHEYILFQVYQKWFGES